MLRRALFFLNVVMVVPSLAAGQEPPTATKSADPGVIILKPPDMPPQPQFVPKLKAVELQKRDRLSGDTRMKLIQLMQSEFGHVRRYIPLGEKNLVIDPQGVVRPDDAQLYQRTQAVGAAAKVGDKVQITNIFFRDKSVYIEINGGPKKKTKWYDHLSLNMGTGDVSTGNPDQPSRPTGAAFNLEFKDHVPEMTGDELKQLLSPVIDFGLKSAAEVFAETLPPKVLAAIKAHEVLVGMNKEMVVLARDRAQQKVREKDDSGKEVEEWIYGTPPQDVVFVRFDGDEVIQVKIAKPGGQMIVKTDKEVEVKDGVTTLASLKASDSPQDKAEHPQEPEQQPSKRPTLKREGEDGFDPALRQAPPTNAQDQGKHPDEPQWGTKPPEAAPPELKKPPR
jgi:hypothetical protein